MRLFRRHFFPGMFAGFFRRQMFFFQTWPLATLRIILGLKTGGLEIQECCCIESNSSIGTLFLQMIVRIQRLQHNQSRIIGYIYIVFSRGGFMSFVHVKLNCSLLDGSC